MSFFPHQTRGLYDVVRTSAARARRPTPRVERAALHICRTLIVPPRIAAGGQPKRRRKAVASKRSLHTTQAHPASPTQKRKAPPGGIGATGRLDQR